MVPGCVGVWAWARSDLRRTCRAVERSNGQDAMDGSFSVGHFREFQEEGPRSGEICLPRSGLYALCSGGPCELAYL
jgi:hypothetical protein